MGKVLVPSYGDVIYNDDVSFQLYQQKLDLPSELFNGKVVYASSFYHETPKTRPFIGKLKDVTFVKCNLDNVLFDVQDKVTLIQCSCKNFSVQNDNEDWILDSELKPIEPINKKMLELQGKNTDPMKIPKEKVK